MQPAVAAVLVVVAIKGAVLGLVQLRTGELRGRLVAFDGQWYASVAEGGYQWPVPEGTLSNLAFFPLYPFAARALSAITSMPIRGSLLLIAFLASVVAIVGIVHVGRLVANAQVALLLAVLWGISPRSHVVAMAYTEGLFTAAEAWCVVGVLRRQWWLAGVAAVVGALARPTGIVLVAILLLYAGKNWLAPHLARGSAEATAGSVTGPALAGLCGLAAWAGYLGYVGMRVGRPAGYFDVQRQWGTTSGTPRELLNEWRSVLEAHPIDWVFGMPVALGLLAYLLLLVVMVWTRERRLLIGLVGALLALAASTQGYFHSKLRLMIPAFPAWLPVARGLARLPITVRVGVMLTFAALYVFWSADVMATGPYSP